MAVKIEASNLDEREITGTIIQRRCLGKHLAFVDILVDNHEKESVAFRSASFQGDHFPTKNSALPFGARVDMKLRQATRDGPKWEVVSWAILDSPHDEAVEVAQEGTDGGISCSKYLQARGNAYLTSASREKRVDKKPKKRGNAQNASNQLDDGHGDQKAKALRAKVFASWLSDNILRGDGSDAILDVAGGKGQLSVEIATLAKVPCTVMDPLIRRKPKSIKKLQKQGAPTPEYVARPFYNNETCQSMAQACTCLVGLHPDECTEDILEVALHCNKSVAIVPCCVFPTFFPSRRLRSGAMVNSYEDFLWHLLEKDSRLRQASLNFQGKNQVIYYKVD